MFKPFREMRDDDYAAIGFKSGLEVHQQLLTSKKLFCRCPVRKYSDKYDAEILRHMRPTLSEFGEYDGTALMEFKTKKNITYRIHHDTVCTYEMDDTPPFEINEEALDLALGIALLYNCIMVDEIHVARKQYLDGSIPAGFQRTAILGVDGIIPFGDREIGVVQLAIEEDACREVSDIGHERVYLTDRLGIPLIETVTAPDMRTPHEVAEVAQIIRRLSRSTGNVRTGIGAARQDVNVSVTGGTRIEIKGVPRIARIPLLTYNEAMRQWNLLRLRDELHKRGIAPDSFESNTEHITCQLVKTEYQPIKDAVLAGNVVKCVLLRGFRGLLAWHTQTDTRFSREISDRVRVVACLTTLPNIIHSDSPGETISSAEWQKVKEAVGASDEDTVVVVWGDDQDAEMGANEIVIRAKEATVGIPSETRQALRDGTNGFERILPGADRMYPDTDLPPKRIPQDRLETIESTLPAPVWLREQWYREIGVPDDLVAPLAMSQFASLFEQIVKDWKISPTLAAVALIQFPKRLKKHNYQVDALDDKIMKHIFKARREGLIAKEGILGIMRKITETGGYSKNMLPPPCTDKEVTKTIQESCKKLSNIKLHNRENKHNVLMGLVMNTLRGRIDGAVVAQRVETVLHMVR